MKIQLVRNATMRISYAGQLFLTDPYLAAKHTRPSYAGKSLNPTVDLPFPSEKVLDRIDWVLLSHLHSDHFGPTAQELLPCEIPILCQPSDQEALSSKGFTNTIPVDGELVHHGITIQRIPCQHGSGVVLDEMGEASGYVFHAPGEPSVFWAGDTVLTENLAILVRKKQPEVIITHSCGAVWGDGVLIVMDAAQTISVCQSAPVSIVVAVHMEAVDHATVTRKELRAMAEMNGISSNRLIIPLDGEELEL